MTGSSWARNSTNSAMPPSCRNFSSTGVSPRRSRITSSRPGTMNDVCRARPSSPSNSNVASLVKICRSGQNRIRVPVLPFATRLPLRVSPDFGVNRRVRSVAVEDARGAVPEADALLARRAVDVDVHPRGQRVDDRQADAVQAAGGDVRAAAELAAGVQLGGDHLDAGQPGLGLLVDRDAAAVVVDLDRVVGVQGDLDPVGGPGQRLVHAVVDDLPQAVHEAAACRWSRCTSRDACGPPPAPRGRGGVPRCTCCRSWAPGYRGRVVDPIRFVCWSESTCDTPRPDGGTRAGVRLRSGLRWSNRRGTWDTSRCGNDLALGSVDSQRNGPHERHTRHQVDVVSPT